MPGIYRPEILEDGSFNPEYARLCLLHGIAAWLSTVWLPNPARAAATEVPL
jgi:hypothetical protein